MRLKYIGPDKGNLKKDMTFAVRVHDKKPAYFDAAAVAKLVQLDKRETKFVLRPNSETSTRVNFVSTKKDTWYFVDNATLHGAIAADDRARLEFVLEEGRSAKPAEAAPAAPAAPNA